MASERKSKPKVPPAPPVPVQPLVTFQVTVKGGLHTQERLCLVGGGGCTVLGLDFLEHSFPEP